MPTPPEDDWTRPMPRTPRPRRDEPVDGGQDGAGRTERIPREERYRDDRYPQDRYPQDRYDERYSDERHDDRYDDAGYDADDDRTPPRRATTPPPGRPGPPRRPAPPRRRKRYGIRRILALLLLLVVAYVAVMLAVVLRIWGGIERVDAEPDVSDRPGAAAGENYLLVGTDSREGLSEAERKEFGTGYVEGSRADTVMLLHVPTAGEPTLVSLPRDSYVEIRDYGFAKLNAAHEVGGPALLVDTVEQSTGLPISGYLEIGFGGFVGVVEEVGGVQMCLDAPVQDEKAHIDLPAGCQELTGPEALGYVRMRYSDSRGDLGRVERQRQFLGALVGRMSSPATVLNPLRLHEVGTTTGDALVLGEDTSMLEAARIALAMRSVASGDGTSLTVPVADANYQTPVGSSVLWNEATAAELFTALRNGDPVTVQP